MREPYKSIAHKLLPGWEVSLAFVDAKTALALNRRLRKKSYTPNVLSYKVGEKHGEVIMCKSIAQKQAPSYDLTHSTFYVFLFIHALLHLKGGRHGTTMERREKELLKEFGSRVLYGTTHRNGHRHRHLSGKGGRSRRNSQ